MLTESQLHPHKSGPTSPRTPGQSTNTDQIAESESTLSHKVESNTRLFEILSSRSDIDHPICFECTDLLMSQFESRLQAASKERDAYIAFLKELKKNIPTVAEVDKAVEG